MNIVGAMLVSRNADLLDITIPNMMKWCSWALIIMDNESDEVVERCLDAQKQYLGRIILRRGSFPHKIITRSGEVQDYRRRWRNLDGHIRDEVFINLNRVLEWKKPGCDKIDILILPDSDEIFTDYLPELLERFWKSNKLAVMTKPIDVLGSIKTIKRESMSHHVHILKWGPDYRAYPKKYFALYKPLELATDVMRATYYSVHLALLNKEVRRFREKNWKNYKAVNEPVWDLEREISTYSPAEIKNILKTKPSRVFCDI